MSQPIQLLKQKTDTTLLNLEDHNHDDRYAAKEHEHSQYITTDSSQTLTNKTLGEPTLASQKINLKPSNLTNTEITLPAYEGINKYTLLTSQDIETISFLL